jgi:hypothetical protein
MKKNHALFVVAPVKSSLTVVCAWATGASATAIARTLAAMSARKVIMEFLGAAHPVRLLGVTW